MYDFEEEEVCEICGSVEGVTNGICIDCREEREEWDEYQDEAVDGLYRPYSRFERNRYNDEWNEENF